MARSITLHPEHGVNPTLGICFWCRGETGEIGLLGMNRGKEAKRHTILNYEPCPKCVSQWEQGVVFVECHESAQFDGHAPIARDRYPSGRYMVLDRAAVPRVVQPEQMANDVLRAGKAYIEPRAFNLLMEWMPEEDSDADRD